MRAANHVRYSLSARTTTRVLLRGRPNLVRRSHLSSTCPSFRFHRRQVFDMVRLCTQVEHPISSWISGVCMSIDLSAICSPLGRCLQKGSPKSETMLPNSTREGRRCYVHSSRTRDISTCALVEHELAWNGFRYNSTKLQNPCNTKS